jgi:hypothetical protein
MPVNRLMVIDSTFEQSENVLVLISSTVRGVAYAIIDLMLVLLSSVIMGNMQS